jgi:hypothetical protein
MPAYRDTTRALLLKLAPPAAIGLLFLAGCGLGAAKADEAKRSVLEAFELRALLLRALDQIKSLRVVYRGGDVSSDSYVFRTIAAKEPCCLYHDSTHGSRLLDWRDDPGRQTGYLTSNGFVNYWPMDRRYQRMICGAHSGLPGTLPLEFFFRYTGIWPMRGRETPKPFGRPEMLFEVASSANYRTVRPLQELVAGRWCHVLEYPGFDSLWLDTSRGCCLLRRDRSRKRGTVANRIELSDHGEVTSGVWLPRSIHVLAFDDAAPTVAARTRVVSESRFAVLELSANNVADSVFAFMPGPGAMSRNLDRAGDNFTQTEPRGLDHLEDVSRWMKRTLGPPRAYRQDPGPLAAGATAVALLLLCEVRRFRKRRRAGDRARQTVE